MAINTHRHVSTRIYPCVTSTCVSTQGHEVKLSEHTLELLFMPSASCLPVFTTSLKKCLTTIVLSDVADFFLCWLSSQHSGDEIRTIGIEIRVNSEHCWLERKDKPRGKETVNLYADSIGGQAIKKGNKPSNEKVYNNATAFCLAVLAVARNYLLWHLLFFRYSCMDH